MRGIRMGERERDRIYPGRGATNSFLVQHCLKVRGKRSQDEPSVNTSSLYSRTNRMTHPSIIPPSVTHAPYYSSIYSIPLSFSLSFH